MGTKPGQAIQHAEQRIGRDEMNLAEFPITLLTDHAPEGQKTLVFREGEQTLTVTGSDAYGLPTALDADVIVALIQLTKQANNFTNPVVPFTRYGLIKLLGWQNKGSNYQRLTNSLKCWTGVTLNYENAWWDNKAKRKVDATFHIIESLVISELIKVEGPGGPSDSTVSTFTWGNRFFDSCRADNLKRLDLDVYFSLKSSISKRMYRFLDKRFFHKPSWTFDLHEFAYEHVGLTRNYADNGKIKEKLRSSIRELESIGFISPLSQKDRFQRVSRGSWAVAFAKGHPPVEEPGFTLLSTSDLEQKLWTRGVSKSKARMLIDSNPHDLIERQIEYTDFIRAHYPDKVRSPGGFLRKAIEEDYAPPPGFVSKEEQARVAAELSKARATETHRKRSETEARSREEQQRRKAERMLDSLSASEIAELDREMFADTNVRADYENQAPGFKRVFLRALRIMRIRDQLKD